MTKTLIEAKLPMSMRPDRRGATFIAMCPTTHAALRRASEEKNYKISTLAREYVEYCLREEGYLEDQEVADVPSHDPEATEKG